MSEYLQFASRNEYRDWLSKNCTSSDGVRLLFGKRSGPKTLSANDALEEALCYGWIDGQMQSLDDRSYIKYFAQRGENSKWSDKNKGTAQRLEKQGLMTDYGRAKIEEAKKNGQWDKPKTAPITEEQIEGLADLLKEYEPACANFQEMPPSVKKTYCLLRGCCLLDLSISLATAPFLYSKKHTLCGNFSFIIRGGKQVVIQFMNALQPASNEVHVADIRTCVLHPASETHRQLSDEQLKAAGIEPGMIRLSVGLEDLDDMMDDLRKAFT